MSEKRDSEYKCQLDEASQKRARKELNERNDKDRDLAVQTLREWILNQKEWLKSPTDYEFLLRFLRVRKFSQLEARKTIENYWTLKTKHPNIGREMDISDPVLHELFSHGIYIGSKNLDKDGCRLLICNLGRIPLEKVKTEWGRASLYKAFILACEWLIYDENTQVNGMKQVWEYTDLNFQTVKHFITTENNMHVMKFMSKCMPARVKGIYTYNDPPFLDVILSMFAPFLSKKLRDRIVTTGKNLTKFYEYIDKNVLPDEYLPDEYSGPSAGPVKQVVADMMTDMQSEKFRRHIQEITSPKYGIDFSQKSTDIDEVASFRRLNVD